VGTKTVLKFILCWDLSDSIRIRPKLEEAASSFVVPLLNKKDFSNIEIFIPPLPTQKKIAAVLEKAEKLREWRKEADGLTDRFLKSTFLEMFGDPSSNPKRWEVVKLRDISEIRTGGTPDREIKEYWENGNIPWVKTAELKENSIYNTDEFITELGLKNSNANIFPKNSILIAMYGQGKTRGRSAKLGINAATNQACAVILPSENFIIDYLAVYMKLSYNELRILGRGGNQPNLNLNMVKNFTIFLPPNSLQQKFASIVKQVEQVREHQKESKQQIDHFFNVLMQRAFRGELEAK
jgi:type I restriction enzyme S subunit